MLKSIVNAAPGLLNHGVKDESIRAVPRVPQELPQHLPKFLIYAQKGPSVLDAEPEQLLVGNERIRMYGAETFTEGSPYFMHNNLFSNVVNKAGNAAMYVRLLGKNHGPKATLRLWLDVLPTTVDTYERNSDGSIKTNVAGDPIVTGSTPGYRVKFVVTNIESEANKNDFGNLTIVTGDQVDTTTGATSNRYPIMEMRHSFYGKDGNLAGIRIFPQNVANVGMLPSKMINKERAYPFNFGVIRKNTETGNTKYVETLFGEQYIMVTFKPDTIDPLTRMRLYIGERALTSYQNLTDVRYPLEYGEFGEIKMYQENIDLLLGLFQAAEAPFLSSDSDFTADEADKYMFNFITGTDTRNIPYHSYIFADSADSVRFSANSNVFAAGGDDGEMTLENYAAAAGEYIERYGNPNDELMDNAYHVESHLYDSGFPLATKYKLINFIAERKDTFIHLVPGEFGERKLTAAEELSVAMSLQSRLALYPESSYFGTEVYRGMITGGVGKIRGSEVQDYVSLCYEIAYKSARYMGAGNGVFRHEFNPEGEPGHIITEMYDISHRYIPTNIKLRNWDMGLNQAERFDRTSYYFPAMKTVYGEDSSVLTGYIFACILLTVNKSLSKCQRIFSGRSDLTPAQLTKKVNDWLSEDLKGKFDDRVIIRPKAHFTTLDEVRNFSWTVPCEVGGKGMRTVMTAYAVARRYTDMEAE